MTGETSHAAAAEAYERIAASYDRASETNPIQRHMRAEGLATLLEALRGRKRALEIGCGTGEEAAAVMAALPELGVVCCDPSEGMLRSARARFAALGLGSRVRLLCLPASRVDEIRMLDGRADFDAGWASYSLSYEGELAPVARSLAGLLLPDSPLVVTLRNTFCLAEPWSLPSRMTGSYRHKVGAARVRVSHWSPSTAARAFESAGFRLDSYRALPLVLPPPRYGKILARLPRLTSTLRRIDPSLARLPVLRSLGDHTLMVFRRHDEDRADVHIRRPACQPS